MILQVFKKKVFKPTYNKLKSKLNSLECCDAIISNFNGANTAALYEPANFREIKWIEMQTANKHFNQTTSHRLSVSLSELQGGKPRRGRGGGLHQICTSNRTPLIALTPNQSRFPPLVPVQQRTSLSPSLKTREPQ